MGKRLWLLNGLNSLDQLQCEAHCLLHGSFYSCDGLAAVVCCMCEKLWYPGLAFR